MNRRDYLRATAAIGTATTAVLAGCSGSGGDDSGENAADDGNGSDDGNDTNGDNGAETESPSEETNDDDPDDTAGAAAIEPYVTDAAFEDEGPLWVGSIDYQSFLEIPDDSEDEEELEDPIASLALWSFLGPSAAVQAASTVGVHGDVENAELVHDAGPAVIEGSVDVESAETSLEDGGFSAEGTHHGFDVYVFESEAGGQVVATGDDTMVIGVNSQIDDESLEQTRSSVETVVAGAAGEATRLSDQYDAFDDLAEAMADRLFRGVTFDPDGSVLHSNDVLTITDVELEGDAYGFASAQDIDVDEGQATFTLAIRYVSEDEVDEEDALLGLAANANERDLQVDGKLATVEATYQVPSE